MPAEGTRRGNRRHPPAGQDDQGRSLSIASENPKDSTVGERYGLALLSKERNTSATLHACAMHPRGRKGSSASKI
jgi:hypothetical protein